MKHPISIIYHVSPLMKNMVILIELNLPHKQKDWECMILFQLIRNIIENPPYIGFSLLDSHLAPKIDCFVFDKKGQVENEIFKFNERIEIRLMRKLHKGRSRLNCTAKDNLGNWRWFGHQFYL